MRLLATSVRLYTNYEVHVLTRCHCLGKYGSLNCTSRFTRVSGRCFDVHTTAGCCPSNVCVAMTERPLRLPASNSNRKMFGNGSILPRFTRPRSVAVESATAASSPCDPSSPPLSNCTFTAHTCSAPKAELSSVLATHVSSTSSKFVNPGRRRKHLCSVQLFRFQDIWVVDELDLSKTALHTLETLLSRQVKLFSWFCCHAGVIECSAVLVASLVKLSSP